MMIDTSIYHVTAIRAFSDPRYDYYRLKKPFGRLKKGTIFYHDPDDKVYGSVAAGCLKLCWAEDGSCQCNMTGGAVVLHADFKDDHELFEKITRAGIMGLPSGKYSLDVTTDGTWIITKQDNLMSGGEDNEKIS